MLYLAGKDDDLLDDSSSLVLEELLNDVATNVTCPSDGEVRVSRHECMSCHYVTIHRACDFQSSFGAEYYLSQPHRHVPWRANLDNRARESGAAQYGMCVRIGLSYVDSTCSAD